MALNLQVFGKAKCFDTKKAERFFKERGIKYQYIDLPKYGMSKGEYNSVKAAVGHYHQLLDTNCRLYRDLNLAYLAYPAQIEESALENPGVFRTPIVRCGKKATIGYQPEVWQQWIDEDKKG